jgi:hypothetical protein
VSLPFVLTGICSGWIVELAQSAGIIPGTYDVMDIVLSLAGGITALLVCWPSIALQLPVSMRAVLSVLFFGLFWIFAVATSSNPCSETIRFVNNTGHPVHIVEEKGRLSQELDVFIDSAKIYYLARGVNDSQAYYLFVNKHNVACEGNRIDLYPGILENGLRAAHRDSMNPWGKYSFGSRIDTLYLRDNTYRTKIIRNDKGNVIKVDFWLPADSSYRFSTEIPLKKRWNRRNDDDAYESVYTIDYQSPHGNTFRKVISGRQFYKVLRKGNLFVIE